MPLCVCHYSAAMQLCVCMRERVHDRVQGTTANGVALCSFHKVQQFELVQNIFDKILQPVMKGNLFVLFI